ncbi:conserved membrane hypothetical protein [Paraburkholderia ribeironis]|uniref:Transmembrane protein n=1 Tax=Paraburkholderia ribeironis TaxID=1247936 RepID=A0A1N7RME5_9BURK|nr:hypothetical protein [Paraburkholderia ribeironis]SIT36285.1 conserved membrane hypothetical protein [Paraburkholderia ribeironis]
MQNQLTNTEKTSVVVASASLAAAALALGLRFTLAPTYADFIVGSITWGANTKFQDMFAPLFFMGVLLAGLAFLSAQIRKLKSHGTQSAYAQDLAEQLLWWSIPSVVVIAGLIAGSSIDRTIQLVSAAGLLILGVSAWLQADKSERVSPWVTGLSLFSAFLLALVPLEIALVLGRAPVGLAGPIDVTRYAKVSHLLIGGLFLLVLASAFTPRLVLRILPKSVVVGQLGLPLFFLTLYPARLALPDGSLTKYSTTWALKALAIALVVAGVVDVFRRYVGYCRDDRQSYKVLFSPLALFGLLIAFKFGNTIGPSISPNDYEFGQNLLGWSSYLKGVAPYVGYISPHGFMEDDLPGLLSVVFYDGTAASIFDATRLSSTLLALVAFFALFEFSGSLGLALVSTFFIGGRTAFLFFTPFMCLWFSGALRAQPARWLAVWLVTASMVVLGVPPAGLLLAAASGILALEAVWRMWRGGEREGWKTLAAVCVAFLVLALATPLAAMLIGAIRYVLENGPINQVAYGIAWENSWKPGSPKSGLVFESIRMLWLGAPAFCLMMVYSGIKNRATKTATFLPAVVVMLFALLLTPYSMGRIDPGDMSRAGLAAIFGWSVLIPIIAWHSTLRFNRVALVVLVAGMSATLTYTTLAFSTAVSAVSSFTPIGPLKNGADVGMPNVGHAMVQDEQWARLIKLNTLLNSKLAPGAGYLDLTSHNAQTFYFGRPVTMAVTAAYNMAPVRQQQRAVERLSRDLPSIALLSADNITYDGGGLALRDPVLYRFVMDRYTPVWADGAILGFSAPAMAATQGQRLTVGMRDLTDDKWDRGVSRTEAALSLDVSTPMSAFAPGTQIRLHNGETHKVAKLSAEQHVIWLDGGPLDPAQAGYPGVIDVTLEPALQAQYRLALQDTSFAKPELGKIPVAWGRSDRSLSKKMTQVTTLDALPPTLHDLQAESGVYKVTGGNPQLSFDLSTLNVSGHGAGLLRFEFACMDRRATPRFKVAWWGDAQSGPAEAAHLTFTGDDGVLIVPLDAYPRWLTLQRVLGLQMTLADANACGTFGIRNVALYQRNIFR